MKQIIKGIERVLFDLILFAGLVTALFLLPTPERQGLELLMFKAIQVSAGFLHAHIMRKLAFPKINWYDDDRSWLKGLVIALYVIVIFSYARGG